MTDPIQIIGLFLIVSSVSPGDGKSAASPTTTQVGHFRSMDDCRDAGSRAKVVMTEGKNSAVIAMNFACVPVASPIGVSARDGGGGPLPPLTVRRRR